MRINKNILTTNEENDIKYRGPFSYRHLRIFAWVGLALGQVAIILSFALRILGEGYPDAHAMTIVANILNSFSIISAPLFLIANFSLILKRRQNFFRFIIFYACAFLAVYGIFLFFYFHYFYALLNIFMKDSSATVEVADVLVKALLKEHASFNIFVDLLIWTLFYFFLTYVPKKHFKGKKIHIFRSFIAFPILYELIAMFFKGVDGILFTVPTYIYPLISTKPFLLFLAFIFLCLFVKHREMIFRKNGRTMAEYSRFLNTNTASLHFSIFTSAMFLAVSITDIIFFVIIRTVPGLSESVFGQFLINIGLGQTASIFIVIPFVMLFSYNRTHKESSKMVDILIPVCGLLFIALSMIETIFQLVINLLG